MIKTDEMKKILYIISVIAALLSVCSCEKESGIQSQLAGEWHCTVVENEVTQDVYISFGAGGQFEMYQMTGKGPYWYTSGKYYFDPESNQLSGKYSDGYTWKYSYEVTVSDDTMVMKAVGLEGYSVSYTRTAIPDSVKAKSLPLTKSETVEFIL